MKEMLLAGIMGLLILSCSKKENVAEVAPSSETAAVSEPAQSNLSGDQIIETLDCSGCHSVSERMIGPSYQEIAGKYTEKDVELLASKIIEGGSGVWGGVPMAAHPQVSKEDAKKMVEYILSQKK
ncbi:cytochrome C [Chryseobacterium sp. P1-3]|uniref:Cytochrome C n=1 Tax=Chryseobacterium gallinarum TaxID=1324352 RepID=A0A0G3M3G0_CHRGL|nr:MULTISPECIES: c-type cytochrome [Chryseobacterium]AKK73706.1 cytochrome C [Chryseobacterium gallinarum]KFF73206.1 cytochrome C [Chryseobacterium sp. P1-3]MCL8537466.1 c-type cytochrome [Chryseobacterium gallinarum]